MVFGDHRLGVCKDFDITVSRSNTNSGQDCKEFGLERAWPKWNLGLKDMKNNIVFNLQPADTYSTLGCLGVNKWSISVKYKVSWVGVVVCKSLKYLESRAIKKKRGDLWSLNIKIRRCRDSSYRFGLNRLYKIKEICIKVDRLVRI